MAGPGLAQFYLSFTDRGSFLGALIITAATLEDAITVSWMTGLNPGGAVTSLKFPAGTADHEWTFRLLTAEMARKLPRPDWLDSDDPPNIELRHVDGDPPGYPRHEDPDRPAQPG